MTSSYQPEIDVATYLANAVSSLTLNTSLHYGGILPPDDYVPALAAFVLSTGGPSPLAYAGSQTKAEHYPTVQIYVRGGKLDYTEARTLAQSIYDALAYAALPGYLECRPLQSGPIYLGTDDDGHHAISLNFELLYEE